MNWNLEVLKNYAEFSEQARSKEYWMFVLFNMISDNFLGIAMVGGHRQ
jgi:uncharacterized membrane protein YhaH (DUF805 family)